jgi:cyclin B
MHIQNDINYKMRGILVDWLLEVHYKFKMHAGSLWLCVNIIDRFLSKEVTMRSKLQLVGVVSLLIACKFEEVSPPEVKDCIYITDYAYDKEEVLRMESRILNSINYNLIVPTGYHFLIRYLNRIRASNLTRFLANYYAERNLQESDILNFKSSLVAASCVYLALLQQVMDLSRKEKRVWNRALEEETSYSEKDLYLCAYQMITNVSEEAITNSKRKLTAAKKKYNTEKCMFVSALDVPTVELLKECYHRR